MAAHDEYAARASVCVAPLHIVKSTRGSNNGGDLTHSRNTSQSNIRPQSSQQQITPPPTPIPPSPEGSLSQSTSESTSAQASAIAQEQEVSTTTTSTSSSTTTIITTITASQTTPSESQEDDGTIVVNPSILLMHHYLRAFFPFHPTLNPTTNTVTLPLNIGDIILVHSVHTNGWADGTMLSSGARGWLPTNYCEGYDLEQIRPLLRACLSLFDQCKGGGNHQGGNQGVVTGVVAGVRYLLEKTDCLTRETRNVQANDRIRRYRKLLLSDLSSLVKAAKRIPEHAINHTDDFVAAEEIIDEMVLRTFKIVVRGAHFLDSWYEELQQNIEDILRYAVPDEGVPPTPPCESASTPNFPGGTSPVDALVHTHNVHGESQVSDRSNHYSNSTTTSTITQFNLLETAAAAYSRNSSILSAAISEDTSLKVAVTSQPIFALSRLNATHDTLLSYLACYVGMLELQSRSPRDIHMNTKKSASAAQDLLAVVEAVHARDPGATALDIAKKAMYGKITALVNAAREVIATYPEHDDDGIVPHDESIKLRYTATGCVRGAGECVAKARFVIDRIGDFELDVETMELGYDVCKSSSASVKEIDEDEIAEEDEDEEQTPSEGSEASEEVEDVQEPSEAPAEAPVLEDRDLMPPPPPPAKDKPIEREKPLPSLPINNSPKYTNPDALPPLPESPERPATIHSRQASIRSILQHSHALSRVVSSEEIAAAELIRRRDAEAKAAFERTFRVESVSASSAATNSTYLSNLRDSEVSLISQTSTRATSPDLGYRDSNPQAPKSGLNSCAASIRESGSVSDAEPEPMTYQHAHELTFKDGVITGGTLPALVERLTVHDSTPDAVFVATFYLTFRLFCTPVQFAEGLVERFDAVANSAKFGTPVRLRVYNVFKGWLESHWRKDCDSEALDTINNFAVGKLGSALPAAGKRLHELAAKVSSIDGPLVPRLVSCMGKTNTATAQYTLPDAPLPSPNITRSQLNMLRTAASTAGPQPNILDFDPLELARQFTLKESRMFCSILPEELIAQEWAKKNGSLAVNVRAMSALSTDLAHLVAETILAQEDSKRRAVVIKQWIKIADRCLELNNYDSLMAIMCTMNASTILRLKKTWEHVSAKTKQTLEQLRAVIDVSKNHAVLRARLRSHVPPCLPFLGTYLTDLTFVDVGNPSKRPLNPEDGTSSKQVINFDKHVKTARIISELQRFQIPYRIAEVPELQQWIDAQVMRMRTSKAGDVQTLYRRSLLLEPRETSAPQTPAVETPPPTLSIKDKFDLFSWTGITHKALTPAALSPSSSSTSLKE